MVVLQHWQVQRKLHPNLLKSLWMSIECYGEVNVAVTSFAADSVTLQLLVPLHAPLQPVKREPLSAFALSVTLVPFR